MSKKKVAVLVGSLRKESYNRKVANQLIELAPDSLELELIEIGHLAHYNEDLENDLPKDYNEFRQKIKSADAYLFVTPEYNRTVPSALKNALDVASRPYGQNVWAGKPAAVVSVSMSAIGGFGANHVLRQSMVFLNVFLMQQPEAYIGSAHTLFDDNGELVKDDTKKFLTDFINAFAEWADKF